MPHSIKIPPNQVDQRYFCKKVIDLCFHKSYNTFGSISEVRKITSKKMGRPTNNPKPNKLNVRVDDETLNILDEYCKSKNVSRPEGVRDGIKSLKDKT